MPPAHQGFEAQDSAARDVDHRLVAHDELISLQSLLQTLEESVNR
jgi:hypothetical protein